MWDLRSPWSLADWGPPIPEKDTSCAPLCQHPPCWQSNLRKLKGIQDLPPQIPPKEEIETGLLDKSITIVSHCLCLPGCRRLSTFTKFFF